MTFFFKVRQMWHQRQKILQVQQTQMWQQLKNMNMNMSMSMMKVWLDICFRNAFISSLILIRGNPLANSCCSPGVCSSYHPHPPLWFLHLQTTSDPACSQSRTTQRRKPNVRRLRWLLQQCGGGRQKRLLLLRLRGWIWKEHHYRQQSWLWILNYGHWPVRFI